MKMGVMNAKAGWSKTVLAAVLAAGLVAGCMDSSKELSDGGQSTSSGSGVGAKSKGFVANVLTSGQGPIKVDPSSFAKDVYCPPIQLQSDTYLIMKFARGKENDPSGLLYQATVEEWARSCKPEGSDQTRIKVGLSGHVTPGPAWEGGEVILPVRVAVLSPEEGAAPLQSELITIPVTLGTGVPSEAWTMIEDNFVVPRNEAMKVVFGFDEGGKKRR